MLPRVQALADPAQHPVLANALWPLLMEPSTLPPWLTPDAQAAVLPFLAPLSLPVVAAFLRNVTVSGAQREARTLDIIRGISTLLRPSVEVVHAMCDVLQSVTDSSTALDLGVDEEWRDLLLITTGMVRKVSWHLHGQSGAHDHAADLTIRDQAIATCASVLDKLVHTFVQLDGHVEQLRAAVADEVRAEWERASPAQQTTAVFQNVDLVGLPYSHDLVANDTVVDMVVGRMLRVRDCSCTQRCYALRYCPPSHLFQHALSGESHWPAAPLVG